MLTIVSFLAMLSVIVVVHEFGHYKVAVLCGVKVLKFSVGFGKPLLAWQLGPFCRVSPVGGDSKLSPPDPSKTLFLISAVPLGGYVQMLDEREGGVAPEQIEFAFNKKSLKARAAIVLAGPIANLLLAVLLYSGVQWVGQLQPSAVLGQPLPGSLAEQADLRSADRVLGLRVVDIDGGFQTTATYKDFVNSLFEAKTHYQNEHLSGPGSTESASFAQIVEIAVKRDEKKFKSDEDSTAGGGESLGEVLDKTIGLEEVLAMTSTQVLRLDLKDWQVSDLQNSVPERLKALKQLGLTGPMRSPTVNSVLEGGVAQKAGLLAGDQVLKIDGVNVLDAQGLVQLIHKSADMHGVSQGGEAKRGAIWEIRRKSGANESQIKLEVRPRVIQEDGKSIGRVDAIIGGSQELVFKRLGFWDGIAFASRLTFEQALTSLVSFKSMVLGQLSWHELSGPLTLAEYAGKTAQGGWASFVSFVAFVSVSIGVLNLLPIPVLDGGQLMYYLWELLSGRAPSEKWNERLTRLGLATVLLMMCAAMFNDVLRLIGQS